LVWTSRVADAGEVSEDMEPSQETTPESVLFTIRMATDVKAGIGDPTVNVHLTSKRVIVEPLTSNHLGATIAGGLIGRAIAEHAAKKQLEKDSDPVGTVHEILQSSSKVYAIDCDKIKKVLLRRKDGAGSVCLLQSSQKGHKTAIIKFDREMFDAVSELLAGMVPGKVTVK
jgi:hypothetical protein